MRTRLAERRRAIQIVRNAKRDMTPPPPSAFRAFGRGSLFVPPARINSPHCISIGDGTIFLEHAWLSVRDGHSAGPTQLTIGNRVRFGRCASIACIGSVTIGDDVLTSDYVFIADCFHEYADPHTPVLFQPMSEPDPVVIESGAYLGSGCIVLPGVTVGEGAYVGEGAVVTKDVPARAVVMGNPARVVETYP